MKICITWNSNPQNFHFFNPEFWSQRTEVIEAIRIGRLVPFIFLLATLPFQFEIKWKKVENLPETTLLSVLFVRRACIRIKAFLTRVNKM